MKNKGYITVEASLVTPVFLFFMMALYKMAVLFLAEAHVHQSLAEAAGYTAQYCYLEKKLSSQEDNGVQSFVNERLLEKQFQSYLGEDFYVEKMMVNGRNGIHITITEDRDNPKIFLVKAEYSAKITIPLLGEFQIPISNQIKQKAFVGYSEEEKGEPYVYVTPNQSVYHLKRSCTHLSLSVQSRKKELVAGYTPCSFCGREERDMVYVARTGNVYHCRADCSGLKRTIRRVRISETGGLAACFRCGG